MRDSLSDPLDSQIRAGREDRGIFLTCWSGPGTGTPSPARLGFGAFSFSTMRSVPFAVELMEPMLVAALDGNPATKTNREAARPSAAQSARHCPSQQRTPSCRPRRRCL